MSVMSSAARLGTAPPVDGAYVIELEDVAAGVLVRDRDIYRFFAAHRDFALLESGVFRNPQAARKAAERMRAATRQQRSAR